MSVSDAEEDSLGLSDLLPTPARPATPPPTYETYVIPSSKTEIKIKLVGTHPLWAHHLWNASRCIADYFDANQSEIKGRRVLELGAGGGLPGIVCALHGAKRVLLTDYPDEELLDCLRDNVKTNSPLSTIQVRGFVWGRDVKPLFDDPEEEDAFDIIIMSDLIFNHSQHEALLKTAQDVLSDHPSAQILVFYTHHRPHLAHRDMEFFTLARERGWTVQENIVKQTYEPMFKDDAGDASVRGTVWGWRLGRPSQL